ncbi:hypothetical protein LRS04_15005 [Phenylobacterium sp. J367]|nr:hypothetical protein [Phenylobacterium sp. J367]MCR5879490.1 hypothetical protein [Phenylobacterium sp. J367]
MSSKPEPVIPSMLTSMSRPMPPPTLWAPLALARSMVRPLVAWVKAATSMPAPPSMRSSPKPPSRMSSPPPPETVSSPAPP